MRLINDLSWNDLSFFTGKIPLAISNFEYFTKQPLKLQHQTLSNEITRQYYFDKLMWSLSDFKNKVGLAGHNLSLILVGKNNNGPFTILEGNHTVMALYFEYYINHPYSQYPSHYAYVGISPNMFKCRFHHIL
jgi:hypothetical protein